ncbi:inter-alpha-trypsin inhibitor-like isoform X1 [Styela clava]
MNLYLTSCLVLMTLAKCCFMLEQVQVTMEEEVDICSLPYVKGPCKANFERWYYDGETCTTFQYGGCKGNNNNFLSEHECSVRCPIDCLAPAKKGQCKAKLERFYYDAYMSECIKFEYGGCNGNTNNFRSIEQCMDACQKK